MWAHHRRASSRVEWTVRLCLLLALAGMPGAACASVLGVDGVSFGDAGVDAVGQDGSPTLDSAAPPDATDGGRESRADGPAPESSADAPNEAEAADDADFCSTCLSAGWACGDGAMCTYAPNGATVHSFQLTCPPDVTCVIQCSTAAPCGGGCSGSSCTFDCTGDMSCSGVACDASTCNVNCLSGAASCVALSCDGPSPCCVSCSGCGMGSSMNPICATPMGCAYQAAACP
jgi:hypothetical protein